jgi:hypothetical protein
MLDKPINYFKSLTTTQKAVLLLTSGSIAALSGSTLAYRYFPRFTQMVEDHKMIAGLATVAMAAPILGMTVPVLSSYIPAQAQLPAYGAIHLNGLHMGALAMRNNPLAIGALAMRNNPIAMNGIHMNGAHAMHGVHAMNGLHI